MTNSSPSSPTAWRQKEQASEALVAHLRAKRDEMYDAYQSALHERDAARERAAWQIDLMRRAGNMLGDALDALERGESLPQSLMNHGGNLVGELDQAAITATHSPSERSKQPVEIFGREVGPGCRTLIVAELAGNHQGSADLALRLVDAAADAGADVIKLQKRTPELAVPRERWDLRRTSCMVRDGEDTITELEHRKRIELGWAEYISIATHAKTRDVHWFASPWDPPSVAFLEDLEVGAYKIASASVTDIDLIDAIASTGKPVIASTGASTWEQVDAMVERLDTSKLVLLHTCSAYPAANEDIHLRVMDAMRERYGVPIGYSGHERGLQVSLAAVAREACVIERHITLDRTMPGSDHAASLEPHGFKTLVRDIRVIEAALGSNVKRVSHAEESAMAKLRRVR